MSGEFQPPYKQQRWTQGTSIVISKLHFEFLSTLFPLQKRLFIRWSYWFIILTTELQNFTENLGFGVDNSIQSKIDCRHSIDMSAGNFKVFSSSSFKTNKYLYTLHWRIWKRQWRDWSRRLGWREQQGVRFQSRQLLDIHPIARKLSHWPH